MGDRVACALRSAVAVGLSLVVGGCEAFKIGNPFLPKAKLLVTVEDALTTVTIQHVRGDFFDWKTEPERVRFKLQPFPDDITPGVRINAYRIDWFDSNGSPILGSVIPARTQGVSLYLERGKGTTSGSGGGSGTGTAGGDTSKLIEIPVVTNPVVDFGKQNGFVFDPAKNTFLSRTDNWSQFLTGRVTFSGRDDNGYALDNVVGNFTLRFVTNATPSVN